MLCKFSRNTRSILLLSLAVILLFAGTALAARRQRDDTAQKEGTDPRRLQRDAQNKKIAEDAGGALDANLKELLQLINQNQIPDAALVGNSKQSLKDSKRFLKKFNDAMKCQYYMLAAWTNYYESVLDKAFLNASKACKTDGTNHDARATQAAIAVFADRKPMIVKPERQARPRPQSNKRQRRQKPTDMNMGMAAGSGFSQVSSSSSSGNILNLDVDAIDSTLLGQKVDPLTLNCVNDTGLSYNHDDTTLCILLWQSQERDLGDPNDSSNPNRRRAQQKRSAKLSKPKTQAPTQRTGYGMMGPGMGPGGPDEYMGPGMSMGAANTVETGFTSSVRAYSRMFASKLENNSSDLKFIAVNTDDAKNKKAVIDKMLENPWPWAQVIASDPESGAGRFADIEIDPESPTMLIVNKEGTIKYAGPPSGFLAPMVLQDLNGIKVTPLQSSIAANKNLMGMSLAGNPLASQALQEMDPQAEKLVEFAKSFIEIGHKIGSHKKGVDICREIIAEYPNTKYADRARELLRTIPENKKKKYNLTNTELGL